MKILITSPIFSPETRGPATYLSQLIPKLEGLGHKTMVVSFTSNPKITSISKAGGTISRQVRLFLSILKTGKSCDLIYSQGADVVGFASVLAGKFLHKPVIIKFVGDLSEEMERDFQKKVGYLFFITKITLNLANRIIFPAKHLQDKITKKYRLSKSKTVVIYNAVND